MKEELDNICEECKKEDESVSHNSIMYGYKFCETLSSSFLHYSQILSNFSFIICSQPVLILHLHTLLENI